MNEMVYQREPQRNAPITTYAALADHIEAGHALVAVISENSAGAPQTVVTHTERIIEIEKENGAWGGVRVRTQSGWHTVGESGSLGPRVPFTDNQCYWLTKRVTVRRAEDDAEEEAR
jgi:hypothetical protein